jgi:magnesium chelatase family protein
MIGPPGAGKTMAASCIPSILPPMTQEERIEITKIYSAAGLFNDYKSLIDERPFRAPHNTISKYGLVGGGSSPYPGEITLSSGGVLFLDEILEFKKDALDLLRQPMEDHEITISRFKNQITYPADFMLIAASNPCPCGYFPNLKKCHCSENEVHHYLSRLSGPLMDRIDITVSVQPLSLNDMSDSSLCESSAEIQKRVIRAMEIQKDRFKGTKILFNSRIPASEIEKYCYLNSDVKNHLMSRLDDFEISMRSYTKLLKTARTIADLDTTEDILIKHIDEALMYMMKGQKWQNI